jgi:tetratricopeptide (TPR) repeat protein
VVLFEELIADRPTLAEPRFKLAGYLADFPDTRLRDKARAITLGQTAAELAPREAEPWVMLGLARYRAGDWRGTIEAMDKALENGPDGESKPRFLLAMACQQLGDRDRALKEFGWAVRAMEANRSHDEDLLRSRTEAAALLGLAELPADVFARP